MKKTLSKEARERLRKIMALAEGGAEGEAVAAAYLLQQFLTDYGITRADLQDEAVNEHRFDGIESNLILDLFTRVCFDVLDVSSLSYGRRNGRSIFVKCTDAQAVEIRNKFAWHKRNFKKEFANLQKDFLDSYTIKHRLYSHTHKSEKDDEPIDRARLMRLMMFADSLSDNRYVKQLKG